jgi:fatty acid desaturase
METRMKNQNSVSVNVGPGFLGILGLIFITLKLTDYIDWSWWWVLAPIWIPFALVAFVFVIVGIAWIAGAKFVIKRMK